MLDKNTDFDTLLAEIRSGKQGRDKVITLLYQDAELNHKIKGYLINNGIPSSDVQTVFNLSIMRFIKTVIKKVDFKIEKSLDHYLCGVARLVALEHFRNEKLLPTTDIFPTLLDSEQPEDLVIDLEQKSHIDLLLGYVGEKCREVLLLWANSYKMTEIAKITGYASDGMAKKKKHECLKKLIQTVEANPHLQSILKS